MHALLTLRTQACAAAAQRRRVRSAPARLHRLCRGRSQPATGNNKHCRRGVAARRCSPLDRAAEDRRVQGAGLHSNGRRLVELRCAMLDVSDLPDQLQRCKNSANYVCSSATNEAIIMGAALSRDRQTRRDETTHSGSRLNAHTTRHDRVWRTRPCGCSGDLRDSTRTESTPGTARTFGPYCSSAASANTSQHHSIAPPIHVPRCLLHSSSLVLCSLHPSTRTHTLPPVCWSPLV